MARKKKYKEGTSDAFRYKKDISKITVDEAEAIINDLKTIYTEYRKQYDDATDMFEKQRIEDKYLDETLDDIQRIKAVAGQYWDLQKGVNDIISDVYYNMEYTSMIAGREIMQNMGIKRGKK